MERNLAPRSQHREFFLRYYTLKYINIECLQHLRLLVYQSLHPGNDLGQAIGTRSQVHSVESIVDTRQLLRRMLNQPSKRSLFGSVPNSIRSLNPLVSDSLKPITTWTQKKVERPEQLAGKDGNWSDLEAALSVAAGNQQRE